MTTTSNRKYNLTRKQTLFSANKPKELQTLTIAELNAISGGRLANNHNETIQKPKASSENNPQELQTLTIAELDAISGAGIGTSPIFPIPVPNPIPVPSPLPGQIPTNHNETMVSLI
ncbi:MAG: hypothetical protein QNJ55_33660 [Xenococcus sp. MO_188.B8]|nr:hypothetical protein [Xenococcus sp. MO_188.B8]